MASRKNFPSGIALDESFCNRTKERSVVKDHIAHRQPLVLISPRRYGKTSLILQVISENKLPNTVIDFLPATDIQFVKNAILSGVASLLTELLPVHKKLGQKILDFFVNLNPKIVLSALGQQVELRPQQSAEKSITEALLGLDEIAKTFKEPVVMVMDEFQQIGILAQYHTVEASIRHAVERSEYVSYVFSGSNRHLLSQMFNDKSRPFYHLCEIMKLERIAPEHYREFIQMAAKKQWKKILSEDALNEILNLTECHTYYVNALCRQLWKLEKCPTLHQVQQCWILSVTEQYPWIADEVGRLTPNQRLILAALAYQPTGNLQAKAFCKRTGLSPSSIKSVIKPLLERDLIYCDDQELYHVLDPATLTYFKSISAFQFEN